jgi:alpha-D-xyloside xylohydrolase
MREAHEKGTPIMRPLFYEFPDDDACWDKEDQYMFGAKYLVAPVLEPGLTKRKVYLPKGRWVALGEDEKAGETVVEGGREVEVPCPIEMTPVFVRQE